MSCKSEREGELARRGNDSFCGWEIKGAVINVGILWHETCQQERAVAMVDCFMVWWLSLYDASKVDEEEVDGDIKLINH
ncbi:hypothetical protein MA16_Dca028419 [Dendrobium catenatum]|uniref:Uncharacterized protein n=1 Tax=Dendrobium catenatum TaxID=906689 RepID=A0A2I0VFU4_9ASPA|nr:hypothetical protein MA16_Dca028419 [Dendrobium catenatum]